MSFPVIVLEGPDCAGKSTLAEFLHLQWGAKAMHQSYRFKDRMPQYHTAVLERVLKARQKGPVIVDRWWPSEAIYAQAFRGGTKWPMMGRMLDRVAIQHNFVYVSCLPASNPEKHLAMFNERAEAGGELFKTMGEVANLYGLWDHRMRRRLDTVHYDMFIEGQDMAHFAQHLEELHAVLLTETPDWWRHDDTRQWTGQGRSPDVLIVGEKSNPKGRHKSWPFFEHANSSLWLTQVLADVGLKEERLAWVNAIDERDWVDTLLLDKIIDFVNPRTIVSLGAQAHKALQLVDAEHWQLPHPAYVKRFERGDPSTYKSIFNQVKEITDAQR